MKKYKFILVTTCLFILAGCSFASGQLLPTNNKGGYKVILGEQEIKSEDKTVNDMVFIIDKNLKCMKFFK